MTEIKKELSDISLQISEPEYRKLQELSYSTLSTYESLGFDGLDHLYDKKESPSFLFGSCVDTLMTEGVSAFNEKYQIFDANITEGGINTCNQLLSMNLPFKTFKEIPEQVVSTAAKLAGFWSADKFDKTRYRKVLDTGNIEEYYQSLLDNTKTVISTAFYVDAVRCADTLKTSPLTSKLFAENNPDSSIKRYYQLKFKAEFEGIGYRNMLDLVIVDYENKIIYPYDLKTIGFPEWRFEENFTKYHYYTQARLYWRILKANLMQDDYFKYFHLDTFRFIVINKVSLTPLIWEFPWTKTRGILIDAKGNEYRDPFDIGAELQKYLNQRPRVPLNITLDEPNKIKCLTPK